MQAERKRLIRQLNYKKHMKSPGKASSSSERHDGCSSACLGNELSIDALLDQLLETDSKSAEVCSMDESGVGKKQQGGPLSFNVEDDPMIRTDAILEKLQVCFKHGCLYIHR